VIAKESFAKTWIEKQRKQYPKADPQLIERQIYAFELVGLLAKSGKPFVFKGGTSLLLLLPTTHRLSIDIDIVGTFSVEDLAALTKSSVFQRVEENERSKTSIPKKHFKFYYTSAIDERETYVLLDVLYSEHGYPRTQSLPLKSQFFNADEQIKVEVPTIDGILGDKLTAFAPNTTGVPFGTCAMNYKQQAVRRRRLSSG
jgi:predicted nucleotidyltransferase component of viral defense system